MRQVAVFYCCCLVGLCAGCSDAPQTNAPIVGNAVAPHADPPSANPRSIWTTSVAQDSVPGIETTSTGAAELSGVERSLFEWFDGVGFPDFTSCPFVQVESGASGSEHKLHSNGFLLQDSQHDFTVFTLDDLKRDFSRTAKVWPAEFNELDLRTAAAAQLKLLRGNEASEFHMRLSVTSQRLEIFILARGCAAHGLIDQTHDLLEECAKIPDYATGESVGMDRLPKMLEQDMAYALMFLNMRAFSDPTVSRPELLKSFQTVAQKLPNSEYAAAAREMVVDLETLIAEDGKHVAEAIDGDEDTPVEKLVAELIYRLRDQRGIQISNPGCDMFLNPPETENQNVARRLVAMGYAPVPQLIEHLDDDRLTRGVTYQRIEYLSHRVLRVCDYALAIIEQIAHRPFHDRNGFIDLKSSPDSSAIKLAVKEWWAQYKVYAK